ncbi:hypothetical protein OPV22_022678 [Ensete ventricosum]|uniref:RNA helicase n=1 Tax=Ensete ventricosum TaxID=4639 RepID=A0AAV8PED0_ENSVE|nr:hypothetical protein OPV22_022678 [Ensete ventricosum]
MIPTIRKLKRLHPVILSTLLLLLLILTPPYKDLVAQAHNGSGKTTCFVLGMLSRVDPKRKIPQAICICPTRELAQQNHAVFVKMGKYTGITSISYASRDGFRDDSERIMKEIQRSSGGCQVLLFSATFDEAVKAFVSRVIKDGNQIFVKKEELTLEKVKQYKVQCPDELSKVESLTEEGYECTSVHGALKQEDRDKIIKEFKDGLTKVLMTTDLLARGFDQRQVNLVINYDLPIKHDNPSEPDCELYLRRVGRTGRFGSKGAVFNFLCTDRDRSVMEKIERHFQHHIPEIRNWRSEEDFEAALKDAGLL